ncbi:uncharacterized protein METZ01_LOCUS102474, partial [marine metagenome]
MSSEDKKLSFIEHLKELRRRLIRSVIAILVVFAPLIYFSNDIYQFASNPLQNFLLGQSTMIATEVASPFLSPLKLTFYASLFISLPYVLFEIWGFVAPGMYKKEKTFSLSIGISSVLLFYTGIVFAYYLVFPLMFGFFTTTGPADITIMTDISKYLDFILNIFLAFAIAFEMPVLIFLLNWTGITSPKSLSEKRPYVIVSCFILGMLLTPP